MSERALNESKWTWRNGPVRADVIDRNDQSPVLQFVSIRRDNPLDHPASLRWSLNEMKAVRDLLTDIIDHYTPNGDAT